MDKIKRKTTQNKQRKTTQNKKRKTTQTKQDELFYQFVNRIKYMMIMRKEIDEVLKDGKGCLKIYKKNTDGTFKYRIGTKIILSKKIGSTSNNGEVYLSEFRDKSKKYTFVSKIYEFEEDTIKELKILELLTKKVESSLCPHFLITYVYIKCNNLQESDSFKKTNSKESSIKQELENYPMIYNNIVANKSTLITLFYELANGDLKNFFEAYQGQTDKILNCLVQILLSIVFYYYYTDMTHNDCHWGNFLYLKIDEGGYFHYKIFDEDLYLKNLGFLWVIWDFDFSKPIKSTRINIKDFQEILLYFLPKYDRLYDIKGENTLTFTENMNELFTIVNSFYKDFIYKYKDEFNFSSFINFIIDMIKYFKDNNWLLTELPQGSIVINKDPFVIGKDFISKF